LIRDNVSNSNGMIFLDIILMLIAYKKVKDLHEK